MDKQSPLIGGIAIVIIILAIAATFIHNLQTPGNLTTTVETTMPFNSTTIQSTSTVSIITPSGATGTWIGTYYRTDTGLPGCSYVGSATLVLTQEGDNVTGSMWLGRWNITKGSSDNEIPCISADYMIQNFTMSGIVSGSDIAFIDSYGENSSGNFTSDLMTLHETGVVSTEPGVGCEAYCGSMWTFELERNYITTTMPVSPTTIPPSSSTTTMPVSPTTIPPSSSTTTMSTTVSTTSTTVSTTSTTPTTTTVSEQTNITEKYLMTFFACSGTACNNPQNHKTYLAQSNDGSNWTLVPGFKPYSGSVPDLVRRGGTLYIYNPGTVTAYNISTGVESSPQSVTLKYANGTSTIFVDPSPTLNQNGSIVLFYLPGIIGQDPASCPAGQSSCTKQIMSATEVKGSNGTQFVIDSGVRANIQISGSFAAASDPSVFQDPSGYVLYVSSGPSVLAFSSAQLQGNYMPISGLPNGLLVMQGEGGIPSGYYSSSMHQYWTYITSQPPGGSGVIQLATTSNINNQISASAFKTVVSGCDFPTLGCSYSVESPGIYPKILNAA